MTESVSFDRAADFYDETRAEPPEVDARRNDALLTELRAAGADRLLEVGVGTGRVSRPLLERGIRVTGIDIAPRMMAKLREQLGAKHTRPDLLLADATALPFAAGAFRAVSIAHVLHLVSSYETTLEEVRRVLTRDGVFIHQTTLFPGENPWEPSIKRTGEMFAARNIPRRARPTDEQIEAKLRALGGSMRREVYAERDWRLTASYWIECARNRIDSWSWEVPDEIYPEFFAEYEQWMRQHYGDIEREHPYRLEYALDVWTFDGS